MSERTHFWLRVTALAVIAALAWLPRGSQASAVRDAAPSHAIHASVAAR